MINFHMQRIIGMPIYTCNRQTDVIPYQNPDMDTLGKRLKACRSTSKLKQQEVCTRVGIKQGTLSELENDKYPTSSFVPHLAALYGVEALWLAEGRGPKKRDQQPRENNDSFLTSTVATLKPATERETAMAELVALAGQLDILRLGMLIKTARDLSAEMPAQQTPKSTG